MKSKTLLWTLFGQLAFLAAAIGADAESRECKGLRVIGLTDDQRLVAFRACKPERTREIGFVSGLGSGDSTLVGIDFRVQDGKLYGVGNGGGVYTLDLERPPRRASSRSSPRRSAGRPSASTSIRPRIACAS